MTPTLHHGGLPCAYAGQETNQLLITRSGCLWSPLHTPRNRCLDLQGLSLSIGQPTGRVGTIVRFSPSFFQYSDAEATAGKFKNDRRAASWPVGQVSASWNPVRACPSVTDSMHAGNCQVGPMQAEMVACDAVAVMHVEASFCPMPVLALEGQYWPNLAFD